MGAKNVIELLERVVLGNVEQWILVRGTDEENPIILFLHGGPGLPMMPFHQHFQKDIEKNYLVVHWDQRGTGKSYSENIPVEGMTLSQIICDAYDLVLLLKQRYGKERIYLAGHSWGTIVGMNLINLYPKDFYGFISIGQVVDFSHSLTISYNFALKKAKECSCLDAINELIEIGEPPFNEDDKSLSIILKNVSRFGGSMHNEINFQSIANSCNEYEKNDIQNIPKGLDFSDKHLWNEVVKTQMLDNLIEFSVPIYFVCGKYDYITPTTLIEEYYNKITTKFKLLIILENSAHYPYIEEPVKFSQVIIDILKNN